MNYANDSKEESNNHQQSEKGHWEKYKIYYLILGSFILSTLFAFANNLSVSDQIKENNKRLDTLVASLLRNFREDGGEGGINTFEKPNLSLVEKDWIDKTIPQKNIREKLKSWVNTFKVLPDFLNENSNWELDKHVLFTGPPGSGKSFIIEKICQNESSWFLFASVETKIWSGSSVKAIEEALKQIKAIRAKRQETKPIIVVIEEIDSVGVKNSSKYDKASSQEVNALLKFFDEINKKPELNVIVLATTNNPELLNEALIRPGRLGKRILVDYPVEEELEKMINYLQEISQQAWKISFKTYQINWPSDYWSEVLQIVKKLGSKYRTHKVGIGFRDLQKAVTASLAGSVVENSSEITPKVQNFENDLEQTLIDRKTDLENKSRLFP